MSRQLTVYEDVCAICQGTWCQSDNEPLCVLPCRHVFGLTCFKKLTKTMCPTCRAPFVWEMNASMVFENKETEPVLELPDDSAELAQLFSLFSGRHPLGLDHFLVRSDTRHPRNTYMRRRHPRLERTRARRNQRNQVPNVSPEPERQPTPPSREEETSPLLPLQHPELHRQ